MMSLVKSLIYGAAELATFGRGISRVVGGEQVRFPPRWCRYYPADYEPDTNDFIREHCKSGQTVLDIGAHLGLFTVLMARRVGPTGRVYSFEPTALTRKLLQRVVNLNGCSTMVEVRPEAVGSITGTAVFHETADTESNANSLVQTQRSHHTTTVPTTTLDDFTKMRGLTVSCLKIDVEGAELDLLRGAGEFFARYRPATFLSLHPAAIKQAGGSMADIWHLSRQYGLSMTRCGTPLDEKTFCGIDTLFDVTLLPECRT
jgi:FkbM family methyltransferase